VTGSFLDLISRAWEDEIATETYYRCLADRHSGRAAELFRLLATVERATADLIAPVLTRLPVAPASADELARRGEEEAAADAHLSWPAFLDLVVETYPAFVIEFEALERLAPEIDRELTRRLTWHEASIIEFAGLELAGDPDPVAPIRDYLTAIGCPPGFD